MLKNEANISFDSDFGPQIFRLFTKIVFRSRIPKVSAIFLKVLCLPNVPENTSLYVHTWDVISPEELPLVISVWIQF